MPRPSRLLILLAAFALCAPGVALARVPAVPAGAGNGISKTPPVKLSGDGGTPPPPPAPAHATGPHVGTQLPNTGSDPRLLFLTGAVMTLLGVGLRLRTADAELY